jgi:hypothetical protein
MKPMSYRQLQRFSDKVSPWVGQTPGVAGTGIQLDEGHVDTFVIYLEHKIEDNIKSDLLARLQQAAPKDRELRVLWQITGKMELQEKGRKDAD